MTTLGSGGAVTTNDEAVVTRIRALCNYGGEHGWGMNYKMNKVQAAVGLVQLTRLDEMLVMRRNAAYQRNALLQGALEITLPYEPSDYGHTYYIYPILVKSEWAGTGRDRIMSILEERFGIVCSITNIPTYRRWLYIVTHCGIPNLPTTEDIWQRLFCPPLHPLLNEEQELYISACVLEAIEIVRTEMK